MLDNGPKLLSTRITLKGSCVVIDLDTLILKAELKPYKPKQETPNLRNTLQAPMSKLHIKSTKPHVYYVH